MSKKKKDSLLSINPPDISQELALAASRPDLVLPDDVKTFLHQLFNKCNKKISLELSIFPNAPEKEAAAES